MENERLKHWQNIYLTKAPHEVSWTQELPKTSLEFIHLLKLSKDAPIIDIGAGDSKLVDYLVQEGYSNLTVLDISAAAIERVKARLGANAGKVKYIVTDVLEFVPAEKYAVWHDRAAFHFLTNEQDVNRYLDLVNNSLIDGGNFIIGTFSANGPLKCSGLEIRQYDEVKMDSMLIRFFNKIKCIVEDHLTPFNTVQNFLFCSYAKR